MTQLLHVDSTAAASHRKNRPTLADADRPRWTGIGASAGELLVRRRRVSAGGIAAWSEALTFLRAHLRALFPAVAVLLVVIIIVNIFPGTPSWSSGFTTGFLVAAMFGFAWWLAWVPSGMASRSMGLVAEEWTSDLLRNSPGVWAAIPSLKFHGKDVDHVVIAASGVVAVETKWTAVKSPDLEGAAHQAADAGRTLRLSLRRDDLPQSLFTSVVLFWGPGGGQIPPQTVNTSLGPVRVMSGDAAGPWLASLRTGPLGMDYAESLRREVEATAIQRDREQRLCVVGRTVARALQTPVLPTRRNQGGPTPALACEG